MKFSDIKTFKDFLASFFVLKFEPENTPSYLKPEQKSKPKNKRARTKSGKFKGDNPKTKNVNEAWK
jgi:hypothetical protein|tara:strand:+ start:51 stop:248 length:198 start_codon:yes stop_codon:yes gene_type:complete